MSDHIRFTLRLLVCIMAVTGLLVAMGLIGVQPVEKALGESWNRLRAAWNVSDVRTGIFTILGAVIGGISGFAAAMWPKHVEDKRKRRVLATRLLDELRLLERTLTDIRRELYPAGKEKIIPSRTEIYDRADVSLLLFNAKTVQALQGFYQLVYELRRMLDEITLTSEEALKIAHKTTQKMLLEQVYSREQGLMIMAESGRYIGGHTPIDKKELLEEIPRYLNVYTVPIDRARHQEVHRQAIIAAKAIHDVAQQLREVEGGEWPRELCFPVKPQGDINIESLSTRQSSFDRESDLDFLLDDWPPPTFKHSNLSAERTRCTLCNHIMPAWHTKTGERDTEMLINHLLEKGHKISLEVFKRFEAISDT